MARKAAKFCRAIATPSSLFSNPDLDMRRMRSTSRVRVTVVEPPTDADSNDGLKSNVTSLENERKKREPKTRPGLRELPAHLPRRTVVHTPQGGCGCTACGGGLREIGQDVSEVLDYEPGTFHVVRHVRPKLACTGCWTITQALAPTRPMDRCMAGAGLLTHIR